jgi:HAD superfamily hydrolase (TIGR01509 family)
VLAEEGLTLTEADYYGRYLGFDDRGAFAAMFADAGRPAEAPALSRLIVRKAAYYQDLIRRRGYPFFPGGVELMHAAADRGLRLGVVSGALREEVAGALEQAGIAERVPIVVTAEDVAESKPHPESYLRALELLNSVPPLPDRLIHPHEVLAIEDSPAGLESAAGAGLLTLGVAHTYPLDRLEATAKVPALAGLTVDRIQRLVGHENRAP